jgi:hypothetical protein
VYIKTRGENMSEEIRGSQLEHGGGGYLLSGAEFRFIEAALGGDGDGDPEVAARRVAKRAAEKQSTPQPVAAEAEVE